MDGRYEILDNFSVQSCIGRSSRNIKLGATDITKMEVGYFPEEISKTHSFFTFHQEGGYPL